jgi:hypothetical protein
VFETADEILRRKGLVAYASHAVSWEWDGFQPRLVVFDLKRNEILDLKDELVPGGRIDITISDVRRCVGSFDKDGYHPCMMRQVVTGQHDQCQKCASTWIPVQNCIFEPECDGVHTDCKGGSICAKEHHVYAAFYGGLTKVGMTLSSRFMERAIEQGADAIVQLGSYPNRLSARKAENDLSKALKATQWVRKTTFLKEQGRRLDRDAYQDMLERALEPLGLKALGQVRLLDQYPLPELDLTKASIPELTGRHRGEVIGCKGKFLFYRLRDDSVRLLDMASVPSRYITIEQGNLNKGQDYVSPIPDDGA